MVVVAGRIGGVEVVVFAKRGEEHAVAERGVGLAVEELGGVLLQVRDFLIGEERPSFEFLRPLEWRRGIVRPHAGDVGMPVSAARRCPRFG